MEYPFGEPMNLQQTICVLGMSMSQNFETWSWW